MPHPAPACLANEARKAAMPPEEPVYLELGFPMQCLGDDPGSVNLRIYEPDKVHIIADLHFSRATLGDLLASRGGTAEMVAYRTRRLNQ